MHAEAGLPATAAALALMADATSLGAKLQEVQRRSWALISR